MTSSHQYLITSCSSSSEDISWQHRIIEEEARNVWHPDLIFLRVTDTKTLPKYGTREKFAFWHKPSDGLFKYSETIRITFTCQYNFQDYPFDEHFCYFQFGSEASSTDQWVWIDHFRLPEIEGLANTSKIFFSRLRFGPIKVLDDDGKTSALSDLFRIHNDHLPFDIWITANDSFNSRGPPNPYTGGFEYSDPHLNSPMN